MLTATSEPQPQDLRRRELRQQLGDNAYPGYVYGYPHKKAYRPLPAPVPLARAWADEDPGSLFAYVHLPFCNQRCSFCNLFTYVPGDSPASAYLAALEREMAGYRAALGPGAAFARLYLGGGTPTYLSTPELRRLAGALRAHLGIDPARTAGCIEASPETLDAEKIDALRELGFVRLSLGVQSFVAAELRHVNRRFPGGVQDEALRLLGRAGFPELNVDLIYGLPGQTAGSWRHSLDRAADSPATSLFLYPLYIRPLTGLDRRADLPPGPTPHQMGAMYDDALPRLARAGFRQVSMRHFLRGGAAGRATEYRCQEHGMVGLGAGARSYTRSLHYSTPWRMLARNIRTVIEDYQRRAEAGDTAITHGIHLDDDERRRRFVIQSLLHDGLDLADYTRQFGDDPGQTFAAEWDDLVAEGLVEAGAGGVRLTPRGVRHADVVGQLFFSERVRALIEAYEYDS